MNDRILIYGANGYTGRLAVAVAREVGLKPVLAGRNAALVKTLADVHGFEWRAFPLTDPVHIRQQLADIAVVLHMAGPFSATAMPMVEACLTTGTHYLDITGEIAVFEAIAARGAEAQRAGVMLLPGAGFDVVPSDCLLAHVHRRLPTARTLLLAISGLTTPSRGTAKTAVETLGEGTFMRRDGRIEALERAPERAFRFEAGPVDCVGVSWGDVSTAYHSTGVPNVQVYFAATREVTRMANLNPVVRWAMRFPFVQRWLKRRIDAGVEGPSKEQRQTGRMHLTALALDKGGEEAESHLETPEAYALTARLAIDIASRVADGAARPGFQTPSQFLGSDYILQAQGVRRWDV